MVALFSLMLGRLTDGSAELDGVLHGIDGIRPEDRVGDTRAGGPAGASAGMGERILDDLASRTAEAVTEILDGRLDPAGLPFAPVAAPVVPAPHLLAIRLANRWLGLQEAPAGGPARAPASATSGRPGRGALLEPPSPRVGAATGRSRRRARPRRLRRAGCRGRSHPVPARFPSDSHTVLLQAGPQPRKKVRVPCAAVASAMRRSASR